MNASVNSIGEFEKELVITIPWENIKEEYEDILKQYSKAPVKGFRPGKAPVSAIEALYKERIKTELVSNSSPRFCRKALKQNQLQAASALEINEIQIDKNIQLSFKVSFIEMPDFDLPDYKKLSLEEDTEEKKLDEISLKLLEQTHISLHSSLIEKELRYSTSSETNTEEEANTAENRVKLMLILKKIADQDVIEVEEKEVETRIRQVAKENKVSAAEVKELLLTNGGLSRFRDSILAEYVLQYIISIQEN